MNNASGKEARYLLCRLLIVIPNIDKTVDKNIFTQALYMNVNKLLALYSNAINRIVFSYNELMWGWFAMPTTQVLFSVELSTH